MPRSDIVKVNVVRECGWPTSPRARQLEAMFDVPSQEKHRREWTGTLPLDEQDWNVGLIVGPSGCGKSTILCDCFGEPKSFEWSAQAVVDDFAAESIEPISEVCQAVGFNTIPAWLRPFGLLSNGEQFRVSLARRLLETPGLITIDEFTSVVDRQVAKIGSHAVQKWTRKNDRQIVVATCHYDVCEWLRPDWILHPHEMRFEWTKGVWLQRPKLECTIGPLPYSAWKLFAPYHYLTAQLNKAARCFGLWVGDTLAAFLAILFQPHADMRPRYRVSRIVTLPDWQGVGLAFSLLDHVAAAVSALGFTFRCPSAHPSFVRAFCRNRNWKMVKRPGVFSGRRGSTGAAGAVGGRACASFEWIGPSMEIDQARMLLGNMKSPGRPRTRRGSIERACRKIQQTGPTA